MRRPRIDGHFVGIFLLDGLGGWMVRSVVSVGPTVPVGQERGQCSGSSPSS